LHNRALSHRFAIVKKRSKNNHGGKNPTIGILSKIQSADRTIHQITDNRIMTLCVPYQIQRSPKNAEKKGKEEE
jgi:hypothetical protein